MERQSLLLVREADDAGGLLQGPRCFADLEKPITNRGVLLEVVHAARQEELGRLGGGAPERLAPARW